MTVAGENTSSGWRKTYWRSSSGTLCRKTIEKEANWEWKGNKTGSMELWCEWE